MERHGVESPRQARQSYCLRSTELRKIIMGCTARPPHIQLGVLLVDLLVQ